MMCWSYSGYIYRRCKHIGFLVFRRCIMYYMYCTPFPSCVGLWIATRGKCIVATSHTAPSFNKNHMKIEKFLSFLLLNSSSWANPIVFERLNKQQRLFIISNNFPRISFSKANSDCHHAVLAYSRNMKSQCEYFSIFLVDVDIVDYTIHLIILICIRYSKRGLHPVKKCPQLLLLPPAYSSVYMKG